MIVNKKQILLIESYPTTAVTVMRSCRDLQIDIESVPFGQDAEAVACAANWALLIIVIEHDTSAAARICKTIRAIKPLSQIFVVGQTHNDDMIADCLSHGADDFITAPFSMIEFRARVLAALRRSHDVQPLMDKPTVCSNTSTSELKTIVATDESNNVAPLTSVTVNNIKLDPHTKKAVLFGKSVSLTQTEFMLLAYLMNNSDRPCSKNELLKNVLGYENDCYLPSLYSHVNRLRRKLEEMNIAEARVDTIWRFGYRLIWMEADRFRA